MNTKTKAGIHACESLLGSQIVRFVPRNVILKRYNGIAVALAVTVAGIMVPTKMYGNHILAVGIGATVNEILDVVGFA
ncbi:hypothetical protein KAS08_02495 [Candidatus Pacearchaeota archaeon]|nr:hypothetical protein [Candidatus Pacearchaeota archaeon]